MMDPSRAVVEIPLNDHRKSVTLVDRADLELVSGFGWRYGNGYALAQRGKLYIYMHRLIAGPGPDQEVDHINRNTLDNRSANLRACSRSQNHGNRVADNRARGNTSRHKGVCWDKRRGRWQAYVHHQGKTRFIGSFDVEDDAARAYNKVALEIWGEFARLNVLD